MIDKKTINRIKELESIYYVEDFDVNEYKQEIITMLEGALGHKINITLLNNKYFSKKDLERDIFEQLSIEDLSTLVYDNSKTGKEN